jgi:hypothetical protein
MMGRGALDGVTDGEWSVFAERVVAQRDELRETVEKLRKELDVAKAFHDVAVAERNHALHQVSQLRHERRMLRRGLVEARKWVGFCPILPEGIRELCLVRDLMDDTLDEVQE